MSGLGELLITSGVSAFDGQPFCLVEMRSDAGALLGTGQLSPEEVRSMALSWLGAAEAAEHDAVVAEELREGIGLDFEAVAVFINALRARRARD